ncbi:MAG: STAS domain-containing protein [Planctomycetes bacterium]|nr:STAS domain-containing protein [Planctomycetota bacterium]
MEIKSERYGQAVILRCKGDLTSDSLEVVGKEVQRQLGDGAMDIVLNLQEVPFVDSLALEYLLDLQDELIGRDGQLTLTNLDENVTKIFEMTRLDVGFEILPDVVDAVKTI